LLEEFHGAESKKFEFKSGSVSDQFYRILADVTLSDIKKYVFNTESSGTVEIIEIESNQKELAFKMSTATSKPFALLVASDATKWMKDLDGFTVSTDVVSESYFKKLNEKDNTINILLGKQIFAEGWDSNRPNVVNFINIGVSDAQKFVLQAIGRGIRIEPIKGIRKRLDKAPDKEKYLSVEENENIEKYNQGIETVFVFSTNKEAVGAILENIEQNETRDEWQLVEGIEKTTIANDLFVPEYEELPVVNPNKFNITQNDFSRVQDYINSVSEKLLIVDDGISVSTINKVKEDSEDSSYFDFSGKTREYSPNKILLEIENHFNSQPKKLKQFRKIIDTDIVHFQNVKALDLVESELQELRNEILSKIGEYTDSAKELERIMLLKESDPNQYKLELEKFTRKETGQTNPKLPEVDKTFIKEHYYNPVLLASEINKDYFKNIIKEPSEVTFFKNLITYYKTDNNLLKENYDWWYFSKLVENVDDIYIPYFNREIGSFRNFYPDFIFWLKKDDKYIIKFVDPKGITQGLETTKDKVKGFENIFIKDEDINAKQGDIFIELYLYNPEGISLNQYIAPYSVTDIKEIFND
jgi:hypothetical protein